MILHTKFKMMSNLYNEWLTLSATFHEVLTLYKVSKKDEFFIWNKTYCVHKVRARLTKDINAAWRHSFDPNLYLPVEDVYIMSFHKAYRDLIPYLTFSCSESQ